MQQHDFKLFPELTNSQMQIHYFESPHKQITEDFEGKVVKITDGDTIHVKWSEREKPVVVRFIDTSAPERNESGGLESANWLEKQIMGEDVQILIEPKLRVGKWGRIIGRVIHLGMDINRMSMETGHAVPFSKGR
ncbi:hypothetical protein LCGC14_1911250 [marine sediment metagenome]|uniref:TNase-like domain-containing protein n=1 Tax=marine sediment metagenome TaxID=412755 RepID=A0A0F9IRM2_9ZZZZ